MSSNLNVSDLVPFVAEEKDLRTNPFQNEGNDEDMPMPPPSIKSKDEDDQAYKGPMTRSHTKTNSESTRCSLKRGSFWKLIAFR